MQIARRVYRSGEAEYLINNAPCRLKDIKDLFLGSGAGTDAYCIIQQGQVDVLLQTAQTKSQGHLLAISKRKSLSHVLTDVLVARGNDAVIESTIKIEP